MRIPINKELKIIFLKALKNGFINTNELLEKLNLNKNEIDISPLTEEEKNQLFEISLKINKN